MAAEAGPRPRQRYVPAAELQSALAERPAVSFEDLRADADAVADDSLESEERHLDELFGSTSDPTWATDPTGGRTR